MFRSAADDDDGNPINGRMTPFIETVDGAPPHANVALYDDAAHQPKEPGSDGDGTGSGGDAEAARERGRDVLWCVEWRVRESEERRPGERSAERGRSNQGGT